MAKNEIKVTINVDNLDEAIEKVKQLAELLAASQEAINSQLTVGPVIVNGQIGTDQFIRDIAERMKLALDRIDQGENVINQTREEVGLKKSNEKASDQIRMERKYANAVLKFFDFQREDIEASRVRERKQLNINPDSFVGREILYQTALLKAIKEDIAEIRMLAGKEKQQG